MGRFIVWAAVQLLITALTWEFASLGKYLVNRASDGAVVVGTLLVLLSLLLGAWSSYGLAKLAWRQKK